jgi:hypothetical protein
LAAVSSRSSSSTSEDFPGMSVQADQLLFRYLSRVGDLAQGVLAPANRLRLVSNLRSRIDADRVRLGINDAAGMQRLLDGYGEPAVLVAAEAQRDPGYQAQLAARLTPAEPEVALMPPAPPADAADALSGPVSSDAGAISGRSRFRVSVDAPPSSGPEVPLDPDPFADGDALAGMANAPRSSADLPLPGLPGGGVGLAGASPTDTTELAPAHVAAFGGDVPDADTTASLPVVPSYLTEAGVAPQDYDPTTFPTAASAPVRLLRMPGRGSWQSQPGMTRLWQIVRGHVRESLAIAVFVVGLILGSWIPLVIGYLIAVSSYVFTANEKRFGLVGVPAATLVAVALGFWLNDNHDWGGTKLDRSAVIGQAGSFFGTVPRILAALAALYFGWRLARKVSRDS